MKYYEVKCSLQPFSEAAADLLSASLMNATAHRAGRNVCERHAESVVALLSRLLRYPHSPQSVLFTLVSLFSIFHRKSVRQTHAASSLCTRIKDICLTGPNAPGAHPDFAEQIQSQIEAILSLFAPGAEPVDPPTENDEQQQQMDGME